MIESRIQELHALRAELLRLRKLADQVADDWPGGDCVCHIVEAESITATKTRRKVRA